ncbi:hypothetical protein [Streptomyces sp. NPDC001250]|uniref:hypothetical protein n=1 Tax=unclassified Streptomyces TaxID=2593676 RepID=UPI00332F1F92
MQREVDLGPQQGQRGAQFVAGVGDQPPTRTVRLTLDRVYDDPSLIARDVAFRFGRAPLSVEVDEVDEVDYVRETTRVSARYPAVPGESVAESVAQDTEPREQVTVV